MAVEHAENLEEIVDQRTAQLAELSRTDPLTRLHNIRSFYEHLRRELSAAERHRRPLSLIYLDLNGFKRHNDTYGHTSGNAVLSEVGDLLRREVRAEDTASRYGGDEFTPYSSFGLPGTGIAVRQQASPGLWGIQCTQGHQLQYRDRHDRQRQWLRCRYLGAPCR